MTCGKINCEGSKESLERNNYVVIKTFSSYVAGENNYSLFIDLYSI